MVRHTMKRRFAVEAVDVGPDCAIAQDARPGHQARSLLREGLLVALAIFGLLWLVGWSYREVYVARVDDVTALADGLLLVPGARWEDWFTEGHSHFFDAYPEWPRGITAFARPAFQFLIYLAHFLFGRDWSSYLALNYLGIAAVVAVAFAIARSVLRLGTGAALVAAALVFLSPSVLQNSIWQVGFASEPLAGALVGGAFLALVARKHTACGALLLVALFTKETVAWAPVAAAMSAFLQPPASLNLRRRLVIAGGLLLPLVLWLAFRFAVYGGIGGTYATASYSPLLGFLQLTFRKVIHFDHLFITEDVGVTGGSWPIIDWLFRISVAGLLALLFLWWAIGALRALTPRFRGAMSERQWPTVDARGLVTLWAVTGLALYVVLPVSNPVYATSAVMLAWPAVVAGVWQGGSALRAALAACLPLSLMQMAHLLVGISLPPLHPYMAENYRAAAEMGTLLRNTPAGIRQIFVVSSARSVAPANPAYLRAFLGLSAQIVHLIDIDWNCGAEGDHVTFDYARTHSVVTLNASLPECATFEFGYADAGKNALSGTRIRRDDLVQYELPEAHTVERNHPWESELFLGRQVVAQVHPRGSARFVIERGGADGGLAWFDTP